MKAHEVNTAIARRFSAPEWATFFEVSNSTGFQSSRRADAVSMNIWPSRGNDPDVEQVALSSPLMDDPSVQQWQVIGSTNKWQVFDGKPTVLASNAGSVSVEVAPGDFVQGVAAFSIDANTLNVRMTLPDNSVVYDKTQDLYNGSEASDMFEYYFDPLELGSEFAVSDLPQYANATITITLTKISGDVSVGQIVIGKSFDIGFLQPDGTGFRALDYSYVEDDAFGNLTTVVRPATKIAEYSIVIETARNRKIERKLNSLRGGNPAVWISENNPDSGLLTYGFYRDYRVDFASKPKSVIAVQVQGIV